MNRPLLEVVGIFPALNSHLVGGVQAAGREAWSAIVSQTGEQLAYALQYEPGTSKARTIIRAFRARRKARTILIWHIHLLKLLPFLNTSDSRVTVVLHGVEAWIKQDFMTKVLLRRVNLILSNSDHTWSRFIACNPEFADVPHRTVHLGLGSALTVATPPPARRPAVLMVGRLSEGEDYKGHREMIAAWSIVRERMPDAQLWIVGDGNLRPALEALAIECAPRDSVRFFGQVSEAEKEVLMTECRCLALPSRGEGFGLVYLEAMRFGRPCLVSDLDSGSEVVNPPEAGLSVNPNDRQAIAAAAIRLMTLGHDWERWSARALSRYETHFTGENFRQRLRAALFDN